MYVMQIFVGKFVCDFVLICENQENFPLENFPLYSVSEIMLGCHLLKLRHSTVMYFVQNVVTFVPYGVRYHPLSTLDGVCELISSHLCTLWC